jgi:hypothetical protein
VTTTIETTGLRGHIVVFCNTDRELTEAAGEFLHGAIADGGVAIVVATAAHRLALDARLGCTGVDMAAAAARGSYVELDAAATLSQVMINGQPDAAAFWQVISPLLQDAAGRGGPVRVFGEMLGLLLESGQIAAAIETEALWNELDAIYEFSLLCGCGAALLAGEEVSDARSQICSAHGATVHPPPSPTSRSQTDRRRARLGFRGTRSPRRSTLM